nr:MAG TPA: hypothetical protein [Caudoviricetes sp.]
MNRTNEERNCYEISIDSIDVRPNGDDCDTNNRNIS